MKQRGTAKSALSLRDCQRLCRQQDRPARVPRHGEAAILVTLLVVHVIMLVLCISALMPTVVDAREQPRWCTSAYFLNIPVHLALGKLPLACQHGTVLTSRL